MNPWEKYATVPAPSATQPKPWEKYATPMSAGRAAIVGAGQGATLGYSDEITGLAGAAMRKIMGDPRSIVDIYKEERNQSRGEQAVAREQHPVASTLGSLAGSVPAMIIPGIGAARATTMGGRIAQGAATGAGIGGTMALGGAEGTPAEQAKRTAIGAGIGAVGGAGTTGAIEGIQSGAGNWSIDAARRALGYTKAMLKKPGALEKANRAAKTALKEGVISAGPFNATEKTLVNAQNLAEESGSTIGRIRGELSNSEINVFVPTRLMDGIKKQLASEYPAQGAYAKDAAVIDEINDTIKAHLTGKRITFKSAVDLVKKLQTEGKFTGIGGADPVARRAELFQRASGIASDMLDDSVKVAGRILKKPNMLKEYIRAKELYGQSQDMLIGLYGKRASEQGNNVIGLRQAMLAAGLFSSGRAPEALLAVIAPTITKGAAQGIQAKLGSSIANSTYLPASRYLPLGVGATIK